METPHLTPQQKDLLAWHDRHLTDPIYHEPFQRAKATNDYLASDPSVSSMQVESIVKSFDAEWPIMNVPISVSGKLIYQDEVVGRIRSMQVNDKPLISAGWNSVQRFHLKDGRVLYNCDDELYDGKNIRWDIVDFSTRELCYYFKDDVSPAVFYGLIDNVQIDPPRHSDEYISNIAHYHHPQEAKAIDELIRDDMSLIEQLEAASSIGLPFDSSDPLSEQDSVNLAMYVMSKIQIDVDVPIYSVVSRDKSGGLNYDMLHLKGLLPGVVPYEPDDPDDPRDKRTVLVFDCLALTRQDNDSRGERVVVPINNVVACVSMREVYRNHIEALKKGISEAVIEESEDT